MYNDIMEIDIIHGTGWNGENIEAPFGISVPYSRDEVAQAA